MTRWRRPGTVERPDGLGPVTASALVARPPDWAFEWFTNRVGRWWPVDVGTEPSVGAAFPARVGLLRLEAGLGGHLVDARDGGDERVWATVVGWRPPVALSLCWLAHDGGTTEVDVTFEPAGTGSTWVRLEHRGWAALEGGVGVRASYQGGWPVVLGAYLDAM